MIGVQSGFSGSSINDVETRVLALESAAGRLVDVVGIHVGGGGTYGGQASCGFFVDVDPLINWTIAHGSAPYITWTPNRSAVNNDSVCKQIINGNRDACLDAAAALLRDKSVPIMLRVLHEFDFMQYFTRSDSTLDYTTDATQAQAIIDAWRHVVTRFQLQGATNVGFYWCPDEGGGPRSMVGLAYPGDTWVDWVGSDRYNHADSGFSGCGASGWVDFYRIFNHTTSQCSGQQNYHDRFAVAHGKPFFVGETSTRYDSSITTRKNTWYSDIAKAKDPTDSLRYMSNLIGVSVFDQWVAEENNSDWRIDSNQTAAMAVTGGLGTQSPSFGLNGWVTWTADQRWNVGVE